MLPKRWIVGGTFAWLGRSRRLSKDHEALPSMSKALIWIAMIHLMTKRLACARKLLFKHTLRDYNQGWLYYGKADLIAVETKTSFILIRHTDLITRVEKLVQMDKCVDRPENARYKHTHEEDVPTFLQ